MILSEFENLKITAIAAAVSKDWMSLADYSQEDPQIIKKFIKKTGVEGRYNAGIKQTTSDFCYAAAEEILNKKNINREEIGILVFVTQTSDYFLPATACVLHKRLGLSKDCLAFDVNLGCSGFTYGLNIVSSLLKSSNATKALLLCGDTSAKEKLHSDKTKTTHSATMLFGDSGTATLVEKDFSSNRIIRCISKTDGNGYKAIIKPFGHWRNPVSSDGTNIGSTFMDDVAVFNFTISEVPGLLKETMALQNRTPDDYDCLVLHQANLFIMKNVAKRTGFDMDKTLVSLDKFGNTSSSSIPITLVKHYGENNEDKELHALMCGFGVGLSWSTVDCFVNVKDILPLVHTDEYFEDGYPSYEE